MSKIIFKIFHFTIKLTLLTQNKLYAQYFKAIEMFYS